MPTKTEGPGEIRGLFRGTGHDRRNEMLGALDIKQDRQMDDHGMDALWFSGLEQERPYRAWLSENPTQEVLNARQKPGSGYLVLHKASSDCVAMQNPTLRYSKICGTRDSIERFIRTHIDAEATARKCSRCFRPGRDRTE